MATSETSLHPPAFRSRWWTARYGIGIGFLIVVVCGLDLVWILRNRTLATVDDSYVYLTHLLYFIDTLEPMSVSRLWDGLGKLSIGGRPPLYQLVTIPFVVVFGRSEDAALLVNLFFLALLMASTYQIGRLAHSRAAGLLAALLVGAYPQTLHLSRMYLPHFAVLGCVALSLWLLLELLRDRACGTAWLYGGSLAAGLLVHPHFVWVMVVPAAVFGAYLLLFHSEPRLPASWRRTPAWLLGKLRDRFVLLGLAGGATICFATVLPWYLTHGRGLFGLLVRLSSAEVARFRGVDVRTLGFHGVKADFWWYLKTAPGAISYPLTAFALVGLLLAVKGRIGARVMAVTLIAGYSLLSLQKLRVWWLAAALLPAVAAVSVIWIFELRSRALARGLIAAAIAMALFSFSLANWGIAEPLRPVARALGSPLDTRTCRTQFSMALCPSPARAAAEHWPIHEVLATIFDDPQCRSRGCTLLLVRMGEMSYPLFNYYTARDWPGLGLQTVTEGSPTWGAPYNFLALLESDYLLYPDGWIPRSENPYYAASTRFLQSPPAAFAAAHRVVASFALPDGQGASLMKRIRPPTAREAEAAVAALDLPEIYKVRKDEALNRWAAAEDPSPAAALRPDE